MSKLAAVANKAVAIFPPLRRLVQLAGLGWGQSPQFRNLYSKDLPSHANAFNIFSKQWSSAVPSFETGNAALFDDGRIKWLQTQLGSFQGKRVLELGPLE